MARATPTERSLQGRLAVETSWARTADPSARTAPARRAALQRFLDEVDPDGVLDPTERARRAEHARRAYFSRLALKSAQARRRRREARRSRRRDAPTSGPQTGDAGDA